MTSQELQQLFIDNWVRRKQEYNVPNFTYKQYWYLIQQENNCV